ncbi:MAG: gamma-glutamyl-gamma-aminobutyrate hydrolase family protein [Oligoflexia bacterium]|nr:gamma-glutamyl-gamma-aminobutyrate hydrolase family protein [Oligoflexia bacterium]
MAIFSFNIAAFAKDPDRIKLLTWQASDQHPILILPKFESETNQEAISRYFTKVAVDVDLASYAPDKTYLNDVKESDWKFFELGELKDNAVLIAANQRKNHDINDPKLGEVLDILRQSQKTAVVIPVGATGSLDRASQIAFHKKLARNFNDLILLGGADLSPVTYKRASTYAKFYNLYRDELEIQLVKDFYKYGSGKILGICRGAQLLAVSFGETLYQDIGKIIGPSVEHQTLSDSNPSFHKVRLLSSPNSMFSKLLGLSESNGISPMVWNSYHHQAVKLKPNSIFEPVAVSEDGVVEAFVSKDSRIIGVQAHFERPDPDGRGRIFFSNFLSQKPVLAPCINALSAAAD